MQKDIDTNVDIDAGHGRIETRKCSVISNFEFIDNSNNKWSNLKQVVRIESIREFKNSKKKTQKSTRYYITSLKEEATKSSKNIYGLTGV